MEHDAKVREALALLKQAGRMELLRDEALAPGRPARRSSAEVAAAVASCSPPRPVAGAQVRGVARGRSGGRGRVRLGLEKGGPGGGGQEAGAGTGIPEGFPRGGAPSGVASELWISSPQ
ncbi:hypothetical protein NDU88_001849 [Pleurodeles waltl]|uniref:Uncharacterized protein n=1 Tax=Pleurodeles waltl TaxID=8319 RepID=A0AAV7NBX8_PLEWA|nr:hypothetical protein NDU88_001849 [Pleurodeles waltl]